MKNAGLWRDAGELPDNEGPRAERIPPRQYQVWCICGTSFCRDDLLSARADLTQHVAYWNHKATVPHHEDRYEYVAAGGEG